VPVTKAKPTLWGAPRRPAAAGLETPALVDFMMSKDCPASMSLIGANRANLLLIKQDAIKKPGGWIPQTLLHTSCRRPCANPDI